ncbi:MAG: LytS/YhcK type 5TM receptor domain-containing protein [Candidatus Marinimicrobia bacterium]|nr:LytS/YhcK type 5TM receptor domain-containing protein [Candidatus Neomarinimicrobiota bacterium]
MEKSIIIGLIQNIAVLLSFTLIYDFFWAKDEVIKKTSWKVFAGLLIGVIAVFVMYVPWTLKPGIIFDSRSVLLAVSGLFFGTIPTLIAMSIAAIYRFSAGGDGMWMGVAVILSSGFIGMIWRIFFPPRRIKKPQYNILLLGLVVHTSMFLCAFLLPQESIFDTMRSIALPLLFIYTPGTMLLGMLMLKRWSVWQQQQSREKEELRYRTLFENAGEAILVAEGGFIRFANKRMTDLLEVSYEEMLAKKFTAFLHPDDREFVMSRHQDRTSNINVPQRYSFRIVTRSGEVRWIDINSVLIDWNDKPASLSFLSDVTSKREDARQLVLAKNKAEESDRLKTIFLANMSHEIRTPMNAILGFSDLLNTDELTIDKQEHYINMIQTAGNQLLHIINDIVDISKLEVNQLSINNKNCLLYKIFDQSIEAFNNNPLFKEKKDVVLKLNFSKSCKDLKVFTDPYRIWQVIDNLLGNAIKYTDSGVIELCCTLELTENNIRLETHVKDTGTGIPEKKKNIIFERFRQVEENQYREGAGLGLSISKGIVELMGGKIGFVSEEGKGSDFYFTLDLKRVSEPSQVITDHLNKMPNLKGIHVMVAEDDRISYYLIKEYLQDSKAKVSYAADGDILLDKLKNETPDIILLDINMPKKDGYTCIKEIRKKGYTCKIIAQTAYAMENEKEYCLNSGCHGYISKPIDQQVLFQEIIKVMKN